MRNLRKRDFTQAAYNVQQKEIVATTKIRDKYPE